MELQKIRKENFTLITRGKNTKLNTPKLDNYTVLNDVIYSTENIKIYYSFRGGYEGYKKYDDMDYYAVCNSQLYYIRVEKKSRNEKGKILKKWISAIQQENLEISHENKEEIKKIVNNEDVKKIIREYEKTHKKITKFGKKEDLPF